MRSRSGAGMTCSRTMLSSSPRSMVRGVRNSCEASATNRFEFRNASSRRVIMRLRATDRLSSSSPVAGTGSRSLRLCCVICSALPAIWSTGMRVRWIRMYPPAAARAATNGSPRPRRTSRCRNMLSTGSAEVPTSTRYEVPPAPARTAAMRSAGAPSTACLRVNSAGDETGAAGTAAGSKAWPNGGPET